MHTLSVAGWLFVFIHVEHLVGCRSVTCVLRHLCRSHSDRSVGTDVGLPTCPARQLEWRGYRDGFYISTVGGVANHEDVEYVIREVPLQHGFGVPFRTPFWGCPFR